MTRIIGGRCGGLRLSVPGSGTRPTSDRVREALFSSVESWMSRRALTWPDMRVLDLCAGSGAVGLEAASRGASSVTLVESDPRAMSVLRLNVDRLLASGECTAEISAVRADARGPAPESLYTLVYVDPPYAIEDVGPFVASLESPRVLAPDALVVVERSSTSPSPWSTSWEGAHDRVYGDTRLWYGHHIGDSDVDDPHAAGRSDA